MKNIAKKPDFGFPGSDTKTTQEMNKKITEWNRCRTSIEHENNLLNNRINLFLAANGLSVVVVGLTSDKPSDILMVVAILLANLFWIIGSSQSMSVNVSSNWKTHNS